MSNSIKNPLKLNKLAQLKSEKSIATAEEQDSLQGGIGKVKQGLQEKRSEVLDTEIKFLEFNLEEENPKSDTKLLSQLITNAQNMGQLCEKYSENFIAFKEDPKFTAASFILGKAKTFFQEEVSFWQDIKDKTKAVLQKEVKANMLKLAKLESQFASFLDLDFSDKKAMKGAKEQRDQIKTEITNLKSTISASVSV